MEPVYTRVARDLDVVQKSVAELKNGDDAAVTWWSAERLRTWSTRPWNQDGKQLPLVHHASVNIEVKFRDFAALSAWVGEHVTNTEGFQLTNIRWALTAKRRDELIRQVREQAVHDALERAQLYADTLGLGKISPVAIADAGMLKEGELRAALTLDESVPVYVVCQDFAQMVGTERNPDPSVWDESRSWDGISELVAAITALGGHTKSDVRQAAAQRFWGDSVHQVLHQLRKELAAHLENAAVSDEGEHRRASWLAQLDTLARAAEADLRGRVSAAVGDAVDSPDPAQGFAQALKTSIGAWHAAAKRDIDKLLRSIGDMVTTERARPDWQRFEDLAGKLRQESPTSEYTADDDLVYAPVVRQVGDAVLNALRHYEQSRGLKLSSAGTGAAGTASGVDRIEAAAAGVSVIAELAVIAEQFANRQHAVKAAIQQRAELQSELVKAGDEATALALKTLNELADEARQRINDATADQVDLRDGLRRLVGELRSHIASGEALLSN